MSHAGNNTPDNDPSFRPLAKDQRDNDGDSTWLTNRLFQLKMQYSQISLHRRNELFDRADTTREQLSRGVRENKFGKIKRYFTSARRIAIDGPERRTRGVPDPAEFPRAYIKSGIVED